MNESSRKTSPVKIKFAVDYQIVAQNVPVLAALAVKKYQDRRGVSFSEETRKLAESRISSELWKIIQERQSRRMAIWQMIFDEAEDAYQRFRKRSTG